MVKDYKRIAGNSESMMAVSEPFGDFSGALLFSQELLMKFSKMDYDRNNSSLTHSRSDKNWIT